MGKLDGKVALITGATSGIGQSSALLFASEGATVIIVGRNSEKGKETEKKIQTNGNKAKFFQCDITDKNDILNLKLEIKKLYDHIDIIFNNAGIMLTGLLDEITDEEWDKTYETNLKSVLHICQTFMPDLQKSHGTLLNNASISGLQSFIKGKRSYMYASSKAAVIQFTKYLARNYAPFVRVNCLCPGLTVTNLFTNRDFSRFNDVNLLGRMADPIEIAKAALFLVSDDSSFMTGSVLVVDGGESIKL